MAEGARIPPARKATEAELLVAEMADQVDFHGYKVIQHKVTVDHEKDETRLVVTLLKGNPEQTVLKLKEGGKPDEGEGED